MTFVSLCALRTIIVFVVLWAEFEITNRSQNFSKFNVQHSTSARSLLARSAVSYLTFMTHADSKNLEVIDLTYSPSPEPRESQPTHADFLTRERRTSTSGKKRKRSPAAAETLRNVRGQSVEGLEEGEVEVRSSSRKRRESSSNGPNTLDRERQREERRERKREKRRQSSTKQANDRDSRERSPQEQRRRQRSKSPRRKRSVSPQTHPQGDSQDPFYIDVEPSVLPVASKFIPSTPSEQDDGLILPPHVSVFGAAPVEILAPSASDSDDDEYIEYLNYDERKVRSQYLFIYVGWL